MNNEKPYDEKEPIDSYFPNGMKSANEMVRQNKKDYVFKRSCADPRFLVVININGHRICLFYKTVFGALYGYLINYLRYKHKRKTTYLMEQIPKEEPKREEKKMKDAKEVFAELGYDVIEDDEYHITYHNYGRDIDITFWYEDLKLVVKSTNYDETSVAVDMPLLHAINQQCEELEWIEGE